MFVTMKLILCLIVAWTISSTAQGLVCRRCSGNCKSKAAIHCNKGDVCITASIAVNSSLSGCASRRFRGCANPSECPSSPSQILSVNVGFFSAHVSAQCCNTTNCNRKNLPFPSAPTTPPNGTQCYGCDPLTSKCNTVLKCQEPTDRCFKVRVRDGVGATRPVSGCADSNLCPASSVLNSLLSCVGTIKSDTDCCFCKLCNRVK